ncbi:MAG: lysophospholipase [Bacteroidales bacterium]|nr:lysophospholipase [Bacteroidales bacterium]
MKKTSLLFALCLAFSTAMADFPVNPTFTEKEVTLHTPTGDIFGLLTITQQAQQMPLVIIIAGSGNTDHDGNSPMGVKAAPYKMLAEDLASVGISALRFDKRGIAKSAGAMVSESELRFDHYIDDVVAWVEEMRKDQHFTKIIIAGHSEGSLIGMVAAEKAKADGFISIAGPGRPIDQILAEQLQNAPESMKEEIDEVMQSLKKGETVESVSMALFSIFRPSVQPYLINWMQYDPAVEIEKLRVPVLIIHGATDIQVPESDAELLASAKYDAELTIFENMNHVLKDAEADPAKNMATYGDPALPLSRGLVEVIADFIKRIE